MKTGLVRAAAVAMGILAFVSCSSLAGPRADLAEARVRWSQRGPSSYVMTVSRSCECTPQMTGPVVITVQNGVVVSRTYTSSGAAVPADHASLFPAVDGLFESIASLHREDPYDIDVSYDAALGYPHSISVDMHKDYVDDEFTIRVSSFTAN
jgi:hypothetical protein